MFKTIQLFLFLVVSGIFSQKVYAACAESYEAINDTNVQAGLLSERGDCFISISYQGYVDLTYRAYLISSNGIFMVFLSLGPGDEATSTGAREFFWPTMQSTKLSYTKNGKFIDVKQGSNLTYRFDSTTGQVVSMKGATVQVSPQFTVKNKGGVEITNSPYLLLDAGFKLGSSPSADFSKNSLLRDRFGEQCVVKNNEIFEIVGSGDIQLKYSGQPFMNWLNQRCPVLRK